MRKVLPVRILWIVCKRCYKVIACTVVEGVNTIKADGVVKDYIKIKYKDDDVLYVPTNSLDNIRKSEKEYNAWADQTVEVKDEKIIRKEIELNIK